MQVYQRPGLQIQLLLIFLKKNFFNVLWSSSSYFTFRRCGPNPRRERQIRSGWCAPMWEAIKNSILGPVLYWWGSTENLRQGLIRYCQSGGQKTVRGWCGGASLSRVTWKSGQRLRWRSERVHMYAGGFHPAWAVLAAAYRSVFLTCVGPFAQ